MTTDRWCATAITHSNLQLLWAKKHSYLPEVRDFFDGTARWACLFQQTYLLPAKKEKKHMLHVYKENLSRWWGEDRENPRDEPLSLDRALARSRREVHPEGFPILTSSTWLIIYLAYFLPNPHLIRCFSVCKAIWHIYRVGKCRLTSPSDVITTCVRTHSRTSNG